MSKKNLGLIAIVGGVIFTIISLSADLIRLGSYPGMHWAQITGAALGIAATILGFWLRSRK